MSHEVLKPEIASRVSDDHSCVTVDIDLPEVRSNDVRLKMHEDALQIRATAGDPEDRTGYHFCCAVDPRHATSDVADGHVTVEVPFKAPFYSARDEQVGSRVVRQRI